MQLRKGHFSSQSGDEPNDKSEKKWRCDETCSRSRQRHFSFSKSAIIGARRNLQEMCQQRVDIHVLDRRESFSFLEI